MKNTLKVSDAELYYELRGAGPLLVLVGAPMNADEFRPLAELMDDSYTVLTTDRAGWAAAASNPAVRRGPSSGPMTSPR